MKQESSNYTREGLEHAFSQFASFKLIAETNMSAVFEVYSRRDCCYLALKLVQASGQDERLLQRFESEFRMLAKIFNERLITVIQCGHSQIRMRNNDLIMHSWYTMHLCKEGSLTAKKLSTMHLATRIAVIEQMLDGLSYLHTIGIVHRDIKPHNILIDSEDPLDVKISDFGIAKEFSTENDFNSRMLGGTPPYLAPERTDPTFLSRKEMPDWRPSDQYAAGVTIYQILSRGVLPLKVQSWNIGFTELHTVHQERPLRKLSVPEIPYKSFDKTDEVIGQMMAIQPRDRYPSISECKRSLNAALLKDGLKT